MVGLIRSRTTWNKLPLKHPVENVDLYLKRTFLIWSLTWGNKFCCVKWSWLVLPSLVRLMLEANQSLCDDLQLVHIPIFVLVYWPLKGLMGEVVGNICSGRRSAVLSHRRGILPSKCLLPVSMWLVCQCLDPLKVHLLTATESQDYFQTLFVFVEKPKKRLRKKSGWKKSCQIVDSCVAAAANLNNTLFSCNMCLFPNCSLH